MTNKDIKIGFFLVVWLIFTLFLLPNSGKTEEYVVEMQKMSFNPSEISVKVGDTIKFINISRNLHNVVIKKLKIRSKFVRKGKFVVIKMEKAGEFDYFCAPHRKKGMVGVIKVEK